jgi:hypothetical protein
MTPLQQTLSQIYAQLEADWARSVRIGLANGWILPPEAKAGELTTANTKAGQGTKAKRPRLVKSRA